MRRPLRVAGAALAAAAAAVAVSAGRGGPMTAAPPAAPSGAPESRTLEFVLLDPARMARVRLDVTVDGRDVSAAWDDAFARLLGLYDRDGDGLLDAGEAARLPSPFSLRQVLWGRSAPHTGRPVPWAELDAGRTGRVGAAEVARYYRGTGLGSVSVGFGRSATSPALGAALLKQLDANGDGTVDEAEWRAARDRLRPLDRNGDGLIAAGELVPHAAYPGVAGVGLLLPPAPGRSAADDCPVLVLPASAADTGWAADILRCRDLDRSGTLDFRESGLAAGVFRRLDSDNDSHLTGAELARWRELEPDASWRVEAGAWPDRVPKITAAVSDRLTAEAGSTRLTLRADSGRLPAAMAAARRRLLDLFADAARGGSVGPADVTQRTRYELQQLLAVADRDGDGRLSAAELGGWMDAQEAVARAHVLLTIHDHGRGWFELADADHDGTLSVPELESAGVRSGPGVGGRGGPALTRHLLATVSRGHPRDLLGTPVRPGPAWFRAMDRNGDGEVSREEFVGPPAEFDRLDADRNGRLTAVEAQKAAR